MLQGWKGRPGRAETEERESERRKREKIGRRREIDDAIGEEEREKRKKIWGKNESFCAVVREVEEGNLLWNF